MSSHSSVQPSPFTSPQPSAYASDDENEEIIQPTSRFMASPKTESDDEYIDEPEEPKPKIIESVELPDEINNLSPDEKIYVTQIIDDFYNTNKEFQRNKYQTSMLFDFITSRQESKIEDPDKGTTQDFLHRFMAKRQTILLKNIDAGLNAYPDVKKKNTRIKNQIRDKVKLYFNSHVEIVPTENNVKGMIGLFKDKTYKDDVIQSEEFNEQLDGIITDY